MSDILNNPNSGNGMITKIWGPGLWIGMHSISFGYPMEPTNEQKLAYKQYFQLVADVLPCRYCRESYKEFISTGDTVLDDAALENRESLSRWLYRIHERVNKKLGVDYHVSYEDVARRFESYRAKCDKNTTNEKAQGCVVPSNISMKPYQVAESRDCPLIDHDIASVFIDYGKSRGLTAKDFKYLDLPYEEMDCFDELLMNRNKYCREIITQMRCEDIPSIEFEGEFVGLPTLEETKLILARCSMMNQNEILTLAKKLGKIKVSYKFSS